MEPTTKEHIKYQFCNVYNDLLADLKNNSNLKADSACDNDEITYAISPEKKKAASTSLYKTRKRTKEKAGDFNELKTSRLRKRQSLESSNGSTEADSGIEHTDDGAQIIVFADVHRDASQNREEIQGKKIETMSKDEVFNSLLGKKSNETNKSCSQESDDLFQFSKKGKQKSYPGASVSKRNSLPNIALRRSKSRFIGGGNVSGDDKIDDDLNLFDEEVSKKSLSKSSEPKPKCKTNKTYTPARKSLNSSVDSSAADKVRSSPGWSRIKSLEKDFKDTTLKKPLNISISKHKQSSNKSDSVLKNEETPGMNVSTSDSDHSEVRYFDSPDAAKRCQLMKHVLESIENSSNDVSSESPTIVDPSMKLMASNLLEERKQYVKKLLNPKSRQNSENCSAESPENCDKKPILDSKPSVSASEQSPMSKGNGLSEKNDGEVNSSNNVFSKDKNISSSIQPDMASSTCFAEKQDFSVNKEALEKCEKLSMSTKEDNLLEFSNDCDVSEAPFISNVKQESLIRKKVNIKSKELDNLLTQVVVTSAVDNLSQKSSIAQLPVIHSPKESLCSRCQCFIPLEDPDLKKSIGTNTISSNLEDENEVIKVNKTKPVLNDAGVQTDCFTTTDTRSSRDVGSQTEQIPHDFQYPKKLAENCFDETKDGFILQTVKALMIQASQKLTLNDIYNLGMEPENERPQKKLSEINSIAYGSKFDGGVQSENDFHILNKQQLNGNGPISTNISTVPVNEQPFNGDLKTPQNQLLKRIELSSAKYSVVSTPTSSERKLINDSKFLNRSTICLKDVTVCEDGSGVNPVDDSISKDIIPMELGDDSPHGPKIGQSRLEANESLNKDLLVDVDKVDSIKIKERSDVSNSNDSMVLSFRKSVHRSLNFQNIFPVNDTDILNSSSVMNNCDNASVTSTIENIVKNEKPNILEQSDSLNRISTETEKPRMNYSDNQVDNMEYSEDIRKSLSGFPNNKDTQEEIGNEAGIIENSDDDSIIQATPKKRRLSNEFGVLEQCITYHENISHKFRGTQSELYPKIQSTSLTPDMLSSQNFESRENVNSSTNNKKMKSICLQENSNVNNGESDLKSYQTQFDPVRQSDSNIDSQTNEIPSSLVPSCDNYSNRWKGERSRSNNVPNVNHDERWNANPTYINAQNMYNLPMNDNLVQRNGEENYCVPPTDNVNDYPTNVQKPSRSSPSEPDKPKRIVITTSALPRTHLMGVLEFCKQFDCVYENEITERTTHLVVRTNNNKAFSTMKFILAVASHKLIITVDWITACSKANKILPEDPFIPLSSAGKPGPLNSLLDKDNSITSPLFQSFVIHAMPPFPNCKKEKFVEMLAKCGAKLAESFNELGADKDRVRLVLVSAEGVEDRSSFYRGLVYRYKAFIVTHDWAIESISNYKIEPLSNHNPLNVMYSFEMVNSFKIPQYIADQVNQYFESNEDSYDDTISEISGTH